MYWTNYAEEKILRTFLGTTCAAPTQMYVGLFLTNPGEQGGGTEITYTNYSRQPITFSLPSLSGDTVQIKSVSDVSFTVANLDSGNVTHAGLFDSVTGGNMWAYMVLDEPIEVSSGVAPLILADSWHYIHSGNFSKIYHTRCLNLFRGVDLVGFTPYFALYNGNPDGGGSELSGGGYARFSASFSTPTEQVSGQMMISTSADTSSPRSTDSWGTYSHTAICDGESSGDVVAFKERDKAIIMGKGKAVFVRTDEFSFSLA